MKNKEIQLGVIGSCCFKRGIHSVGVTGALTAPPQRNSSPTVTQSQLILFPSLVKALAPRNICPLGRHLLKIYPLKQNCERKLLFPATYTKIVIFP